MISPRILDFPLTGERSIDDLVIMAEDKSYTNGRPSFRKGVVKEVWENAKGPDGLVRDPNTGDIINWKSGELRKGVWEWVMYLIKSIQIFIVDI